MTCFLSAVPRGRHVIATAGAPRGGFNGPGRSSTRLRAAADGVGADSRVWLRGLGSGRRGVTTAPLDMTSRPHLWCRLQLGEQAAPRGPRSRKLINALETSPAVPIPGNAERPAMKEAHPEARPAGSNRTPLHPTRPTPLCEIALWPPHAAPCLRPEMCCLRLPPRPTPRRCSLVMYYVFPCIQ